MNKRTFTSVLLGSIVAVALIAPVSANPEISGARPMLKQKQLQPPVAPVSPRGANFASRSQQPHQGIKHDSDEQLDVWVARCKKAGGGMILRDDGNYDCVGPHGYPIPW